MRERTSTGRNFKAETVYTDPTGRKVTKYQIVRRCSDYCISGNGFIICTQDNPVHSEGMVIDIRKKEKCVLYCESTQTVDKVKLLPLMCQMFIGVDHSGTMVPELINYYGDMVASNVTYHCSCIRRLDSKHILVDNILYTKLDPSVSTYISQDGIAFNSKKNSFQMRSICPKGYPVISYDRGKDKYDREHRFAPYRMHLSVWDVYHDNPRPDGYQIDHINGDKYDSSLKNLQLVDGRENIRRSREFQGSRNFGWKEKEIHVICFLMSKGLCRREIVRIINKYNFVQRDFTLYDIGQLMSNIRSGEYWIPIASRYNLIGSALNRTNNNVEPISSIEYAALQIYANLTKYDYANDTVAA